MNHEISPPAGSDGDPAEEPTGAAEPSPAEQPTAAKEPTAAEEPTVVTEATAKDPSASAPSEAAGAAGATPISKRRRVLIDVLIVVTTILAVVGMIAVYANRMLFNPDNWEQQSTAMIQDPAIQSATANYVVDQIYAHVDVGGYIHSALPTQLQPLADPLAGALRNAAVQAVQAALNRPAVQNLWAKANRAADQTFIAVVNGGKGPLGVTNGVVTLDLGYIVDQVAARLGLPSNLSSKLPPSVAMLTIFKSNQLSYVQNIGDAVRHLALWLTILVPLLYALAIYLARGRRRRTLMGVGFAIVLAGLVGIGIRAFLETQVPGTLITDTSLREPVRHAVTIGTSLLGEIAGAFVLVGAVLFVAAWFAGPARIFVGIRHAMAPFLREQPVWTFAIAAAVMVLVFIWNPIPATGTLIGIIVFFALAMLGTEVLRRQTAAEFPDAMPGDAVRAMRARWQERRQPRHPAGMAGGAHGATVADQLEKLAALRERGTITAEEYDAAKRTVLGI